ncbi:hypothetical protein CcrBL47_gp396 [Caulobacter phage BL47]|nr:hypothetical protein CcrBL47_gp396 [Caulobacter phage BL47]
MGMNSIAYGGIGLVVDLDAHDLDEDLRYELDHRLSHSDRDGLACRRVGAFAADAGEHVYLLYVGTNSDMDYPPARKAKPVPDLADARTKVEAYLRSIEGVTEEIAQALFVEENFGFHVQLYMDN